MTAGGDILPTGARRIAICAAAVLLALSAFAGAVALPARAYAFSYVIDEARIIPPDVVARIDALGAKVESQTGGAQIAVVTVASLGGRSIEDYGIERARELGVGDKENSRGVVLFVAPTERKMRIEVGYGLEGVLPDAKAGAIIDEVIKPYFSSGDMAGGIEAGYGAIAAAVTGEPGADVKAPASSAPSWLPTAILVGVVVFVFVIVAIVASRRKGGGGGDGGGSDSWTPMPPFGGGSSGGGGGWSSGGDSGGSFGGGDFGGGGASGDW